MVVMAEPVLPTVTELLATISEDPPFATRAVLAVATFVSSYGIALVFGIAVLALSFAWRKIYRPAGQCEPGQVCAVPRVRRAYKITLWVVAALVLIAFASPYFAPLFY